MLNSLLSNKKFHYVLSILIFSSVLLSCSNRSEIVGDWEVEYYTYQGKYMKSGGDVVRINRFNSDNTYTSEVIEHGRTTNIFHGTYKVKNDSLLITAIQPRPTYNDTTVSVTKAKFSIVDGELKITGSTLINGKWRYTTEKTLYRLEND